MKESRIINTLCTFLEKNEFIYSFLFGFRQKHSITHLLIHLTELIRKQLDDGNYGFGNFVEFQKAFDTVDHDILLKKLEHYSIRGICDKWFLSYLTNRNQFVSINDFNSALAVNICGVSQGSILGPVLFLVYINDLYCAIKYCKVHHFACDPNLMNFEASLKTINKQNKSWWPKKLIKLAY